MKRCILTAFAAVFLAGCTDVRTRLSPDILAAEAGTDYHFAAHTSQDDRILSAEAPALMLMPEALRSAAGAEISTGHLSMLAVSGNPCDITEQYFQAQYLAPTCTVLSVPQDACAMLKEGLLPRPAEIQAAVDIGMLPCRTADTVTGDLWGGTAVTAVYAYENGTLTLALWNRAGKICTLSPDACRGLALFGQRYASFSFAADHTACRLKNCDLRLHLSMDERLHIAVTGQISGETPLSAAAQERLREMLAAAISETVCGAGADLLFLHETALRDDLPGEAARSQENRREILQNADFTISIKCT